MKNHLKGCMQLLILFGFLSFLTPQAYGQNQFNLKAGVGLPEAFAIEVGLQMETLKTGLSLGYIPGEDYFNYSIGINLDYHFAGNSNFTDLPPWYGRIGFYHVKYETNTQVEKDFIAHIRFGREIYFSEKTGLDIGLGAAFMLVEDIERKKPKSSWGLNWDVPVVPSIGLGFFYRI